MYLQTSDPKGTSSRPCRTYHFRTQHTLSLESKATVRLYHLHCIILFYWSRSTCSGCNCYVQYICGSTCGQSSMTETQPVVSQLWLKHTRCPFVPAYYSASSCVVPAISDSRTLSCFLPAVFQLPFPFATSWWSRTCILRTHTKNCWQSNPLTPTATEPAPITHTPHCRFMFKLPLSWRTIEHTCLHAYACTLAGRFPSRHSSPIVRVLAI